MTRTPVCHDDTEEHDPVRCTALVRRLDRAHHRREDDVDHEDRKDECADLVLPSRATGLASVRLLVQENLLTLLVCYPLRTRSKQ